MKRCETCSREFTPYHASEATQRFCCRACSDAFYADERREAVQFYRRHLAAMTQQEEQST